MATTPPADRAGSRRDGERCVPASDRTAFALGQFLDEASEARRAEISRHILRCPRCRADVDSISILGSRMSTFGRGGDWEADIGAALTAERGHRRLRRRAALAGFAAAASVVAASWVGFNRGENLPKSDAGPVAHAVAPASRAMSVLGTPIERAKLLAAQAEDGRFSASTTVGGARHDEATTGLAVLALMGEAHSIPKDAGTARALAAAIRWLRTRQGASGRFGPESTTRPRDQAIATAALIEVSAATGDATLRTSADRGVRALRRELRNGDRDAWVRYALSRARDVATGRATDTTPAMGDAFVAENWPLGLADNASVLGRTLAVVELGRGGSHE